MNPIKHLRYHSKPVNFWLVAAVVAMLLMGTPVYTILTGLLAGPGPYWDHLRKFLLTDYIVNSLILVVGTSGLALLWGIPTAWFVSTTRFPGRKMLELLLIMPLSIPTYIMAFTYAGIFDYTGSLQNIIRNIFGVKVVLLDIMNVYGVMIIMSLALFPYVYVIARAAFLTKFRSLIEASQTLGAFSTRTFFQVVLPVSRPALVAGVTLVSMEVLNDYGAVKYFGIPTFTTGIFRSWFSYEDVQAAVYLSSLLLLFVFMILLIEKKQRGEERFYSAATAERPLQMEKPNKVRQLIVLTCCALPVIFGFAIPVIQLAWWSISSYKSVAHIDLIAAVGNSFMLAVGTATSCVVVAVLLLFVGRMKNSKIYNWFMKLSTMGYAIPGAVVAIGVLMPLLLIDKQLISIFQYFGEIDPGLILTGTTVGLLFALTVRFLSVAFNPIESGFEKIGYSLDEVASTLRANHLSRLTRINLPLLKGALGTAALLVFVDILKELPLTLILRPFNFNTLATRSFELASDEQIAAAAVPSIIIIITGLIPVYLLNALITKRSKA